MTDKPWELYASEDILPLLSCSENDQPIQGSLRGWRNYIDHQIFVSRGELFQTEISKSKIWYSGGLPIVGSFISLPLISENSDSIEPPSQSEESSEVFVHMIIQDNKIGCRIDEEHIQVTLLPSTEITRLMNTQNIVFMTEIHPSIVYVHHPQSEQSMDEAVETAAVSWLDSYLDPSRVAFVTETQDGAKKILTFENVASYSIPMLLETLKPQKTGSSRRSKVLLSQLASTPMCLELQLLQNASYSSPAKQVPVLRYNAVMPSVTSLDDPTDIAFEKNTPTFHTTRAHINVLTYVCKEDISQNGVLKALSAHIQTMTKQLLAWYFLNRTSNINNNSRSPSSSPKTSPRSHAKKPPTLVPLHFLTGQFSDYITVIIPNSQNSSQNFDKQYKKALFLNSQPSDIIFETKRSIGLRQILTKYKAMVQEIKSNSALPQLNKPKISSIHEFVSPLGEEYEVYTVKGAYDYYHYMQDGIDDQGWGCAYRSMQTLVSWIVKQDLSIKPVPSHIEIQRMLVEMLDKPPTFVNSKTWIGAVEISMCLSQYWEVLCKILHAQNGTMVDSFIDDLVTHFSSTGSPVMIGGGVLAFTILGVAFKRDSEDKKDIKYLILDPHYTGTDEINDIISGGWCQWKSSAWKQNFFYNICLPQINR